MLMRNYMVSPRGNVVMACRAVKKLRQRVAKPFLCIYMTVKLEIETTEETITLLNHIMVQIIEQENNGLSYEQKELREEFRRKMILPLVLESEYPLAEAFSRFFGREIKIEP